RSVQLRGRLLSGGREAVASSNGSEEESNISSAIVHGVRRGSEPDPHQIGPYRIIGRIGEGGMGIVYLAQQPQLNRRVALKVLQGGMDTKEVVDRFHLEQEAMGSLISPAVARVFEASTTAEGRPYFV